MKKKRKIANRKISQQEQPLFQSLYSPRIPLNLQKQKNSLQSSQQDLKLGLFSPKFNQSTIEPSSRKNLLIDDQSYHHKLESIANTPKFIFQNRDVMSSSQSPSVMTKKPVQQNQMASQSNQKPGIFVPKTYKNWKFLQQQKQNDRILALSPQPHVNRELNKRLKKVTSKIRSDALAHSQETTGEEQLDIALRNKLSRLRQINVSEEPFTYSLQKVHDRSFIHKLLPCIQKQQNKHSPIGASNSKSPNLLKNTFSVEMYTEFLRYKNKKNSSPVNNPINEEVAEEDSKILVHEEIKSKHTSLSLPKVKLSLKIKNKSQSSRVVDKKSGGRYSNFLSGKEDDKSIISAVGMNFKERIERMQHIKKEQQRKQQILEQLKSKKSNGVLFDANFFDALEEKDMDNNLIEIIMFEINKLFTKEMTKYRGITSEYNSMLKRKNLLEAKLFKKRFEKVQKHLNGNPILENGLNPFKRPYQPSIFNDKMHDAKMEIPRNRELFENVIKEAFTDLVNNENEDIDDVKNLSDKEIIQRIKEKFRKRVIENGPKVILEEYSGSKFFEQMIKDCNYSKISKKMQDSISKFTKFQKYQRNSVSQPISPPIRDLDEQQKSLSFFITQGFNQDNSILNETLHTVNDNVKPSNVTSYLNFLTNSNVNLFNKTDNLTGHSIQSARNKSSKKILNSSRIQSSVNNSKQALNKSLKMTTIFDEVSKDIQLKEDIKTKAKSRTLSRDDWQNIGKNRVLQFTILDRIIEDCMDYQSVQRNQNAKKMLGIKNKQYPNTMMNTSRTNFKETEKKKNIEDTFTFLERLNQQNKLNDFHNMKFQ